MSGVYSVEEGERHTTPTHTLHDPVYLLFGAATSGEEEGIVIHKSKKKEITW